MMLSILGESADAGAERCDGIVWEGEEEGERMNLKVRALRSGVEPRTEERG